MFRKVRCHPPHLERVESNGSNDRKPNSWAGIHVHASSPRGEFLVFLEKILVSVLLMCFANSVVLPPSRPTTNRMVGMVEDDYAVMSEDAFFVEQSASDENFLIRLET